MQILSLNFLFYTIGGMWRPIEWSSKCSIYLYSAYTFFVMYLLNFCALGFCLDIILVVDNMDDFITTSFMFFSIIAAICKATTAVTRRSEIINLVKILQEKPCKPCNEEEIDIQKKYDHLIRSCSTSYMLLALLSATAGTIGEILIILQGNLPFRVWVPYDYNSFFLFWLTSLHEMLTMIVGTFVNVATETLVLGFCLQTCAQLEILKHRLQEMTKFNKIELSKSFNDMPNKTSRLSEHICYHLCIIRFAELVNDIFNQVVFVQFFTSIIVLCTSVYYLSSHITFTDFVQLTVFTFCMFVQIFVYCWAGNEVIFKSAELSQAVYQIDWMLLTISEQKDLLMIMKRSTRPIKFTSSFLVTLSLDSYTKILKASYSAFNLLQQS